MLSCKGSGLTWLQHVLPAFVHSSIPPILEIQTGDLTATFPHFTTEVLNPCRLHDLETPSSLQTNPRPTPDLQHHRLHISLSMYGTPSQSSGQECRTGPCPRPQASRRDWRKLAVRSQDLGDNTHRGGALEDRAA